MVAVVPLGDVVATGDRILGVEVCSTETSIHSN